jgi:SAM-dependent methyltransferase
MKVREGGMPAEEMWKSFFDPELIIKELSLSADCKTVVDFGCGYGTFTIPAARMIQGVVYAFDIEDELIVGCENKVREAGLSKVICQRRDFISEGTGLPDTTVDYAMLFNILHAENPVALLREAYRILVPLGKIGVIHWNYDPTTPRGPSMDIRPRPEQCRDWMKAAGFELITPHIDLPPYHYGIVGQKR